MNLTFVIPCYNSETIILKNYNLLINFFKKNSLKAKIIYINDGSKDNTLKKLYSIKNKNVSIINNKVNCGKSYSVINALKKVKTKYVILIDCDLPYIKYLNNIIQKLKKFDLILVNRKIKGSKNKENSQNFYQVLRHVISNFLGDIVEKKLNLEVSGDTQAGLKGFRIIKKFKKEKFISKYYFFDIELIRFFKRNNLKIKMIPVKYKISKKSNIKIFSFKNFIYIYELFNILRKYS